jgi:hypothetical protein
MPYLTTVSAKWHISAFYQCRSNLTPLDVHHDIIPHCRKLRSTGLLKMIVGVLTTCHTQYTWYRSMCTFFKNRITLQVFVTYLTGAPYVHPLWIYKHQHDNRVRSTQNTFSLPFAAILVNCAPSGEMRNYCTSHIIKENSENLLIHRCNCILLTQVYCAWQVVETPTIIFNNPVQQLGYL